MWKLFNTSVGQKIVMAATGSFLGLFIFIHAAGNATAYWGKEAYDGYAAHLHSLGVGLVVGEFFLGGALLLHMIFGVRLYWANMRARGGTGYAKNGNGLSLLLSRAMPYTGLVLLIFIMVHYFQLHTGSDLQSTSMRVKAVLSSRSSGIFYIAALIALFMHIRHGFWSLFQTLGANHQKYNALIAGVSALAALVIGLVLVMLPFFALICDLFLT